MGNCFGMCYKSMKLSYIQKFMFDKLPIKGSMVVLNDVWEVIANQRAYPEGLEQILGELLAANVLLTSNMKLDGKVICQIQDNPHFAILVTECSNQLNTRATAKFESQDEITLDYAAYLKHGRLVVSVDSQSDGQLYQSVIAFNGTTVDEILNNYMVQSEQLQSWIIIAYTKQQVVGFMLQQLPDTHEHFSHEVERVFMLANTLTKTELQHDSLETMLYKLFNEDDIVLLDKQAVNFSCTCSRTRIGQILRNLGKQELEDIVKEQGDISVNCDYCNTEYKFMQQELEQFVLQISLDEMSPISGQIN